MNNLLDNTFLEKMAEKFPSSRFSTLKGVELKQRMEKPKIFLNEIKNNESDDALSVRLGSPLGEWEEHSDCYRAFCSLLYAWGEGENIQPLLSEINKVSTYGSNEQLCALLPPSLLQKTQCLVEEKKTKHHWWATMAISLIEKAKNEGGILPNSWFLWVKEREPILWFLLSNWGRKAMSTEVVVAYSVWMMEKAEVSGITAPNFSFIRNKIALNPTLI